MEFGFEPVCDHLRTSFEPASVMEFGFNPHNENHRDLFMPLAKNAIVTHIADRHAHNLQE